MRKPKTVSARPARRMGLSNRAAPVAPLRGNVHRCGVNAIEVRDRDRMIFLKVGDIDTIEAGSNNLSPFRRFDV
mgnify:CR=1 FL=1